MEGRRVRRNGSVDVSRAVVLPHAPESVGVARHRLCSDLRESEVAEAAVESAVLVLSELVSNSLRHGSPLPEPFPCVRVSWDAVLTPESGWVELAVCDGGGETLPRVVAPEMSAIGGRGLSIVQLLSTRWGTEIAGGATTVWAVLDSPVRRCEPRAGADASGSGQMV